jgi:hypothetical protein
MEIEVFITEHFCEALSGQATCFTTDASTRESIKHHNTSINGFVSIDGNVIPFYFSCIGMDGAIGSTNNTYRKIIKGLIPLYVSTMLEKGE